MDWNVKIELNIQIWIWPDMKLHMKESRMVLSKKQKWNQLKLSKTFINDNDNVSLKTCIIHLYIVYMN